MHRFWLAAAAAASLTLAAPAARAQTIAEGSGVTTAGPTASAAALSPAFSLSDGTTPAAAAAYSRGGLDNGEKLMILGGAALITGAIIGDTAGTIIMVGGAVVGLYGLYIHLGRPQGMQATEIGLGTSF